MMHTDVLTSLSTIFSLPRASLAASCSKQVTAFHQTKQWTNNYTPHPSAQTHAVSLAGVFFHRVRESLDEAAQHGFIVWQKEKNPGYRICIFTSWGAEAEKGKRITGIGLHNKLNQTSAGPHDGGSIMIWACCMGPIGLWRLLNGLNLQKESTSDIHSSIQHSPDLLAGHSPEGPRPGHALTPDYKGVILSTCPDIRRCSSPWGGTADLSSSWTSEVHVSKEDPPPTNKRMLTLQKEVA